MRSTSDVTCRELRADEKNMCARNGSLLVPNVMFVVFGRLGCKLFIWQDGSPIRASIAANLAQATA